MEMCRVDSQASSLVATNPQIDAKASSAHRWMPAIWSGALLLILAFLILYPTAMLLIGALTTVNPVVDGYHLSDLSVGNFLTVVGNPNVAVALVNSLIACGGGTLVAVAVGLSFAWVVVRTNTPWKGLIASAGMLPLFVPPLVAGVAWAILGSPKTGLLNLLAIKLCIPLRVDLYTMPGMIFVFGIYYAPYVYMFTAAALRNMDPALEEAAEISGASATRTMATVTFPLILPAIISGMLLSFIVMLGIYGIPAVLGSPANISVLTTYIFALTAWSPPKYNTAAAVAVILMIVTGLLVYLQQRVILGRSYTTVAGKAFRPRPLNLGPWRFLTLGLAIAYLFVVVVLPTLALVIAAFRRFLFIRDIPALFDMKQYGWQHFTKMFDNPLTLQSMFNSMYVGILTAIVGGILSFAIGYTVTRTQTPGATGNRRDHHDPGRHPRTGDWRCLPVGVDRAARRNLWHLLDPRAGVRRALSAGHCEGAVDLVDAIAQGAGGGRLDLRPRHAGDGTHHRPAAGAPRRGGGDDPAVHPGDPRAWVVTVPVFVRHDGDGRAAAGILRGRQYRHHGRVQPGADGPAGLPDHLHQLAVAWLRARRRGAHRLNIRDGPSTTRTGRRVLGLDRQTRTLAGPKRGPHWLPLVDIANGSQLR